MYANLSLEIYEIVSINNQFTFFVGHQLLHVIDHGALREVTEVNWSRKASSLLRVLDFLSPETELRRLRCSLALDATCRSLLI